LTLFEAVVKTKPAESELASCIGENFENLSEHSETIACFDRTPTTGCSRASVGCNSHREGFHDGKRSRRPAVNVPPGW